MVNNKNYGVGVSLENSLQLTAQLRVSIDTNKNIACGFGFVVIH